MKKLEGLIRSREQLAEGLHLIDFEQLKIENQSLSEKIEERNEELLKLRRKNTNMVQVGGGPSTGCRHAHECSLLIGGCAHVCACTCA